MGRDPFAANAGADVSQIRASVNPPNGRKQKRVDRRGRWLLSRKWVIHLSQGVPWLWRFGARGDRRLELLRPDRAWMGAAIGGRWGSG